MVSWSSRCLSREWWRGYRSGVDPGGGEGGLISSGCGFSCSSARAMIMVKCHVQLKAVSEGEKDV